MPDTLGKEEEAIDLQTTIASASRPRPLRRSIAGAAAAVVLSVASFGAGWLLGGGSAESSPSYVTGGGAVIAGDGLTDRQIEMVAVTEQYVNAFAARDGDGVASFMAPDGYLVMPTLGDRTVRASDGSLQEWVESFGRIPNELSYPIAVHRNQVVLTGRVGDSLEWMMLIEFTDSGDVEIVSDTHWVF